MLLNDEIPIYSLVMSTDTEYAKNLLNERLEKITHLYKTQSIKAKKLSCLSFTKKGKA